MKTLITEGIVLSRTNYGEADRILTILTPDQGKIRLMAKGVRRLKSKLAGGVELFSISELSYILGKNDIGTLISSRLKIHYSHIVEDMDRVQLGYGLIKMVNKITEDHPEAVYFELLSQAYMALDDFTVNRELIRLWFCAQLLKVNGHTPNLITDTNNQKLIFSENYNFDIELMGFIKNSNGIYSANHIKTLRLLFGSHVPKALARVELIETLLVALTPLINTMLETHVT